MFSFLLWLYASDCVRILLPYWTLLIDNVQLGLLFVLWSVTYQSPHLALLGNVTRTVLIWLGKHEMPHERSKVWWYIHLVTWHPQYMRKLGMEEVRERLFVALRWRWEAWMEKSKMEKKKDEMVELRDQLEVEPENQEEVGEEVRRSEVESEEELKEHEVRSNHGEGEGEVRVASQGIKNVGKVEMESKEDIDIGTEEVKTAPAVKEKEELKERVKENLTVRFAMVKDEKQEVVVEKVKEVAPLLVPAIEASNEASFIFEHEAGDMDRDVEMTEATPLSSPLPSSLVLPPSSPPPAPQLPFVPVIEPVFIAPSPEMAPAPTPAPAPAPVPELVVIPGLTLLPNPQPQPQPTLVFSFSPAPTTSTIPVAEEHHDSEMGSTSSLDSIYLDETIRQINANIITSTTSTPPQAAAEAAEAAAEPEAIEIDLGPSMEVEETRDEYMDFNDYLNLSPSSSPLDTEPTTSTPLPTKYEPTDEDDAVFEDVYIGIPGFERPQQPQPMNLTFAPPPPPPANIPGLSLLSDPAASAAATFIPPLPTLPPTPPPLSPLLSPALPSTIHPHLQPTSLNPAFFSATSSPSSSSSHSFPRSNSPPPRRGVNLSMLSSEFVSDSDKAHDEPDSGPEMEFSAFDPASNAENALFSPVQSISRSGSESEELSDALSLSPPPSFQTPPSAASAAKSKDKAKAQGKAKETGSAGKQDKRKREKIKETPTASTVPGETANKTKPKASMARANGERKILKPKSIKQGLNPLERMVREGKM